jgi:hypothetical protein
MGTLSYAGWRRHVPLAAGGLGLAAAAGVMVYKAPDPVRAGLGLAYLGLLVLMAVYDLRTLRVRRPKDVVAFTPFLVGATIFTLAYYRLYLWG